MKTAWILLCIAPSITHAFELNVWSKYDNKNNIFQDGSISLPIHENLLVSSIDKVDKEILSHRNKRKFINSVTLGVRWNDDPINMSLNYPHNFLISFLDSCTERKSRKIDVTWDLLYRTHCGDMQFLHSMASKKDEKAKDTHNYLRAWIEFTYKVATGEYPYNYRFRSANHHLSKRSSLTFKKLMISPTGGRKLWTPIYLYGSTCDRGQSELGRRPTELNCKFRSLSKREVMNYALGSLIHIIQDSYSTSHTKREDNKITQFGLYTSQTGSIHKKADKKHTKRNISPELISVTTRVIEAVLKDRDNNQESYWNDFKNKISKKIFNISNYEKKPGDLGYK